MQISWRIIVVETHRLGSLARYTCPQRLIHAPWPTLPQTASWRKLQKPPQGTMLPKARLWARRDTITLGTAIEANCPANKQSTGLYICLIEGAY